MLLDFIWFKYLKVFNKFQKVNCTFVCSNMVHENKCLTVLLQGTNARFVSCIVSYDLLAQWHACCLGQNCDKLCFVKRNTWNNIILFYFSLYKTYIKPDLIAITCWMQIIIYLYIRTRCDKSCKGIYFPAWKSNIWNPHFL